MFAPLVWLHFAPATITRDSYGVPLIKAQAPADAFRGLGRAISEDRLWQMEMSRHLFRGRMCEITGQAGIASDKDILRMAYTDAELKAQIKALPKLARNAFAEYAKGVNETIAARTKAGTLPPGYAAMGFKPEPWTELDSAAIGVGLARRFGAGGAGEIRNLFAVGYLKTQPSKAKYLDVLDDFLPQNEPRATCTLNQDDAPIEPAGFFPQITREQTERHIAMLPNANMGELMPGLRLLLNEEPTKLAMKYAVPYKTGSYCIVVDKKHSSTGQNQLLSGPQMGHQSPSIIAEAAIETPTLKVAGMSVPGIPCILIGHTPKFAWGLTTGVQDTQDIFFNSSSDATTYQVGDKSRPLTRFEFTLKPKGGEPVQVEQLRTHYGPVVVNSPTTKTLFSLKSAFWGRELEGYARVMEMYSLSSAKALVKHAERIPLGFNLFFATKDDIGYAYCGMMPQRVATKDPRFPLPGDGSADWKGITPCAKLVSSINPGRGVLVNWNNKPVPWWPNLDTPAWGALFRNDIIWRQLPMGGAKISPEDMLTAVARSGRFDDSGLNWFMNPFLEYVAASDLDVSARRALLSFKGEQLPGDRAPVLMSLFIEELRKAIFIPHIGNMFLPDFFNTAVQPSLIKKAIEGRTAYDFFAGRDKAEIIRGAFAVAIKRAADKTYAPNKITYDKDHTVEYPNRGTYIQLVQMANTPSVSTILGPGQAESGEHQWDQVPLVREWATKPGHAWK